MKKYDWYTDAASGTISAASIEDAVQKLEADGEWDSSLVDDGAFLRVSSEDMSETYGEGESD